MTTARLAYNPALDGLRAFAVAGVVVQHAGFEEGGYFGVTVFFVISGYLITSLLLAEHRAQGAIGLGAFYRRRFARLAPALLLVTSVITVWLLAIGEPFSNWWAGLVGTLTYTTDLLLAAPVGAHVGDYFEWSWSLGIEEQFYLVWPLLLIVLLRVRGGRAWLVAVAVAVVAGAWLQRARLSHGHPSHDRINFTFDTHMDAIALGAILALTLLGRHVDRRLQVVAQVLGLAGCIGLFAIIHQPWQTMKLTTLDLGGYGQAALLCLLIVGGVVAVAVGTAVEGLRADAVRAPGQALVRDLPLEPAAGRRMPTPDRPPARAHGVRPRRLVGRPGDRRRAVPPIRRDATAPPLGSASEPGRER